MSLVGKGTCCVDPGPAGVDAEAEAAALRHVGARGAVLQWRAARGRGGALAAVVVPRAQHGHSRARGVGAVVSARAVQGAGPRRPAARKRVAGRDGPAVGAAAPAGRDQRMMPAASHYQMMTAESH